MGLFSLSGCSEWQTTAAPLPHLPDASLLDQEKSDAAHNLWEHTAHVLIEGDYGTLDRLHWKALTDPDCFILDGSPLAQFGECLADEDESGNDFTTEDQYNERINLINQWIAARPDEAVFAKCVLAKAWIEDAWLARGNGFANTVTQNGWDLFAQRLDKARTILESIRDHRQECALWYYTMETLAVGQGWSQEDEQNLVDEGLRNYPKTYFLYANMWWYYFPRWNGTSEQLKEKITFYSDQLGGEEGDILYARAAGVLMINGENPIDDTHLDWSRISHGMELLCQKFPYSYYALNVYSLLSVAAQDHAMAHEVFARIGNHREPIVWADPALFQMNANWAQ